MTRHRQVSIKPLFFLAGLSAAAVAGPGAAHHSAAMFDRSKVVTVDGEIFEYLYSSPHPWLRVYVRGPDGLQQEYDVEGPSIGQMRGIGVTPTTLKPGDKVTIQMHPLKDGRKGGAFVEMTMPDGRIASLVPSAVPR